MPTNTTYTPNSFFLKNGHLNTIYPTLFRKLEKTPFKRIRINTTDEDFLDIDTIQNDNKKSCYSLPRTRRFKSIKVHTRTCKFTFSKRMGYYCHQLQNMQWRNE